MIDLQDVTAAIRLASVMRISDVVFFPFPVLKKQDAAGVFVVLGRFDNSARHFFAGQSINSICASYAVVSGMVKAGDGYVNGVKI